MSLVSAALRSPQSGGHAAGQFSGRPAVPAANSNPLSADKNAVGMGFGQSESRVAILANAESGPVPRNRSQSRLIRCLIMHHDLVYCIHG